MIRSGIRAWVAALVVITGLAIVSGCHVRIYESSGYDVEDETLLAVVTPTGGELFSPTDRIDIGWSGSIDSPTVTLDLYRYGQFVTQIAAAAPNTGWAQWMIPADFDAMVEITDDYQIAIRAEDSSHYPGELYVQAFSEAFTIVPGASGGLSDVTVSQRIITITMTDNGQEIDGDTVDIILNGVTVSPGHVLAGPPGTDLELILQAGPNFLQIVALNEGSISPNTAELAISNVTEGESSQEWRLATGEAGALTITAP